MFISLEGVDGSGKSTQAKLLAGELGPDTLLVREPGGTPGGERIRELLADPEVELDGRAELLLFCAARAQLVAAEIRPALEAGRHVVSDRFADSSVAYQGGARRLGLDVAERISDEATGGLTPDLTLHLRIDPESAATRRRRAKDRIEGEGLALQRAVAEAYEQIAARHPERVVAVDAEGNVEDVHARVMEIVRART